MPRILASRLPVILLVAVAGAPACLPAEVQGAPPALRRMFVTSIADSGDLQTAWADSGGVGGVIGANAVCQARAEAAGLAVAGVPEFRAWISEFTAANDAWCNVQGLSGGKVLPAPPCGGGTQIAAGPWVRTDGILFGDSLAQLTTNGSYVPPSKDEFGAEISGTTQHWTGTFLNGTRSSADCTGWTVSATGQGQPGSERSTGGWGFSSGLILCTSTARLACLEVGVGIPVKKPSDPGHLVFLSSASGSGDLSSWVDAGGETGLAAADEVCAASAGAARLPSPSSFHAWLSDSADDAVCRIQGLTGLASTSCNAGTPPLDAPYRRVDGFVLSSGLAGLLDAQLDTTPSTNELGNHNSKGAWTATTAGGTLTSAADTCGNWALTSGAGKFGTASSLLQPWTNSGGSVCSSLRHLYCVSTAVVIFWDTFETNDTSRWSAVVPP